MKRKKTSGFFPKIRSRHPSHKDLRRNTRLKMPFRSVIRFGSSTECNDTRAKGGNRVEINTIDAIKNSASKFKMKKCFEQNDVKSAKFYHFRNGRIYEGNTSTEVSKSDLSYPLIAKKNFGSRGNGMKKLDTVEDLTEFMNGDILNYYLEAYYPFNREYRLHITKDRCFYTNRKVLKSEATDRWYRNNKNSAWLLESNPTFDKPVNWKSIETECIKALKSVGLDFGACDVRVQSAKDRHGAVRDNPEFIIIEINSAPSFGDTTFDKYIEELPIIMEKKRKLFI